jgi:iron complex outermembrane receptor protein
MLGGTLVTLGALVSGLAVSGRLFNAFSPHAQDLRPNSFKRIWERRSSFAERQSSSRTRYLAFFLLLTLFVYLDRPVAQVARDEQEKRDLTQRSFEELLNMEVTTVGRKPEKKSETPAAVHVITSEDIRRAGVNNLPEALRLAPGVYVGRIDSNKWAIGIRGFASRLSRSQLAMIDGRNLYTPLFAGVYWEVQDTVLEDIERIEVIRGPGGTLWGTNAVNGIINVITKDSSQTQGWLISSGIGTTDRSVTEFRYGGRHGADFAYRFWGKISAREPGFHATGSNFDNTETARAGFRGDWQPKSGGTFTLDAGYYGMQAGQRARITTLTPPYITTVEKDATLSGGHLLGRWQRAWGETAELTLQSYYDHARRQELTFSENRDTFDIDLQYRFRPNRRHEFNWGGGYRVSSGDFHGVPTTIFLPNRRTDHLPTAFLQDEIALVPERLALTLGIKLGHNGYSGFEHQPGARLLWKIASGHTAWGALSRAIRAPSRVEHDLVATVLLEPATPTFFRLLGDKTFSPEKLLAFELGYRVEIARSALVDIAAFYNQYDDLLSIEPSSPFTELLPSGTTAVIVPLRTLNGMEGTTYGVEVTYGHQLSSWWRLSGSYSWLRLDLRPKPGSLDTSTPRSTEGGSPQHMVAIQSLFNLPRGFELDIFLLHVSELPAQSVAAYSTADVRLGWRVTPHLDLSVAGRNLLQPHHAEFGGGSSGLTQVNRSVFGKLTWKR